MNLSPKSFVFRIGGEAGWGLAATADLLARVFVSLGYHVFSSKEYSSLIKGGHNYHDLRISDKPIGSNLDSFDALIAFNQETIEKHKKHLNKSGLIFYDSKIQLPPDKEDKEMTYLPIPIVQLETELNDKGVANTIILGALSKTFGIDISVLDAAIKDLFKEKDSQIPRNLAAAEKGYRIISQEKISFKKIVNKKLTLISGNEAVSHGALSAGLNFHVQYPMTPVTGILHFMAHEAAKNSKLKVVQPEDEIAGINFALGASFAGARSMVATSGGGFALMVESVGLAGMAEVPVVIIMGQRPGPSTGVPTKTEQGDLKFVLSAGTGDFPKIVIAPGDIEECYTETKRAFYLAEKYQLPVIVLIDKHLAESFKTIDLESEKKNLKIDFSKRFGITESVKDTEMKNGLFARYADKKYQRTLPGTVNGMYTCAGDEHDETGEITENQTLRIQMMKRRMAKLDLIAKELPADEVFGPKDAELTVVSWGSNKDTVLDAMEKLSLDTKTKKVNFLSIKYLLPFHSQEVKEQLNKAKKLILVENNYSAQLGSLIQENTGIEIKDKILRYDGKTFTADEIYSELKKRC